MLGRRWPSLMVGTVQGLPSCIFASILQDNAAAPPVCVRIIVCNTHGNAFSCKFSCISGNGGAFLPVSLVPRKFSPMVAAVCRMGGAWSWRTCCRRWSLAVSCSARNIGRGATLLPSPRRRSFLSVSASRWWSPSCSVVLLLRVSCWGFWCSFLFHWGGYIRGYIFSLFNRARNKRARVGGGETCIKHFPALLRYAGDVLGTFEGGYSCENIKSRGGALKCDCDSLVLFGAG